MMHFSQSLAYCTQKRRIVIAILGWTLALLNCSARPNVLFIAVDDLNDWIGCMGGHPQALTPNMDRLAERGVLFTNAHCAAPACNPSRAAVFSGMMPDKTRVWSNKSGSIRNLQPDIILLPTAFAKAGYATWGTGKLLHRKADYLFDDYFTTEQRWSPFQSKDVLYTDDDLPTKGSMDPRHLVEINGETYVLPLNRMPSDRAPGRKSGESFDWGPFDLPDRMFGDTKITDWVIGKLTKQGAANAEAIPFFLGVGYYRPHIPLFAPARFFDRFKDNPGELPPVLESDLDDLGETARKWAIEPVTAGSHSTVVEHGQWRPAVEAYLACVSYVDHEIGRLLDALESTGLADNTVIVLWGDHGWHLGEKEHWGKWTGWERATKVPLIIVPPENLNGNSSIAGATSEQPVGLIDLYPTLMDICQIDQDLDLDGESLLPLLENPQRITDRKLVTAFDPGNVSIRSEFYRYVHYDDGTEELYDHRTDPHEWVNLAGRASHQETMEAFRKCVDASSQQQ